MSGYLLTFIPSSHKHRPNWGTVFLGLKVINIFPKGGEEDMKKVILVLAVGLVALGAGCQKQGKPGTAKSVKGLERIHFDFDQSDVKSEYKKTLKNNAEYLKGHEGMKVTVEGHCDERGTEEYNIALGHRRAKAAKDYLVSVGIGGDRVKTKSYGEEKSLEKCHNESCWWKNRRAEFVK